MHFTLYVLINVKHRNKNVPDFWFTRFKKIIAPKWIFSMIDELNDETLKGLKNGGLFPAWRMLFLSDKGRMYDAYDDYLILMGENVYAAINNIVNEYDFVGIP